MNNNKETQTSEFEENYITNFNNLSLNEQINQYHGICEDYLMNDQSKKAINFTKRLLLDLIEEPVVKIELYYKLGQLQFNDKLYKEAIDNFIQIIEITNEADTKALAFMEIGRCYNGLKEYNKAINHCNYSLMLTTNETTEINPNIQKGIAHYNLQEYDLAIECYEKAYSLIAPNKKINPLHINNTLELVSKLSHSYRDKYDYDKSISNLKDIFKIVKNQQGLYNYSWNYFNSVYKEWNTNINPYHCKFLENIFCIVGLLEVKSKNISKYTSRDTFNKIYQKNNFSKFKINISSSMNDAKEGKTLWEFLLPNEQDKSKFHNTEHDVFISSSTENPPDTISMWNSQYGDICKGISYTFNTDDNILTVSSKKITNENAISRIFPDDTENMTYDLSYYRIAYYNANAKDDNNKFLIFYYDTETKTVQIQKELSAKISELFIKVKQEFETIINENNYNDNMIKDCFIMLSHLVKSITYYHENEIRLLNVSFNKDDKNINYHPNSIIKYCDTKKVIIPDIITLSPYLSQDVRYKEYYKYIFEDSDTEVKTSEHLYNF